MSDDNPSFFARIFLAWVAYFRTLFDADFAAGVVRLREGGPALPPPKEEEAPAEKPKPEKEAKKKEPPPVLKTAGPEAALQLLGLLQREGRFVDFVEEDLADAADEDIGAAARVVHEGCRKALNEHFTIAPVHASEEGERVTVEEGFDAHEIRLTGNVVGDPPFEGELTHRGWKVTDVSLPKMSEGHDPHVIAAAEVELS
ncbi:MAG TPA: DUF2760 domain-containing protein [Sandaracinaceae bacterium LLY-WYZ-13_1]|nr:DUF2760 domain-containing protein [Sandaracinaceae bacterium LLY-WYZ-13_1]